MCTCQRCVAGNSTHTGLRLTRLLRLSFCGGHCSGMRSCMRVISSFITILSLLLYMAGVGRGLFLRSCTTALPSSCFPLTALLPTKSVVYVF